MGVWPQQIISCWGYGPRFPSPFSRVARPLAEAVGLSSNEWAPLGMLSDTSYGVQVPLCRLGNSWMMALRVSVASGCWSWTPEETEQPLSSSPRRTKCVRWEDTYRYVSLIISWSHGFLVFLFPELSLAGELSNVCEKLIITVSCLLRRPNE